MAASHEGCGTTGYGGMDAVASASPRPTGGSSLWAKLLEVKGGFSLGKRTNPPSGERLDQPPPPPGLTLPSAGLSPCLLHPCRAGWQGAKISVGANTRVGDQSFTGVPWGLGTLPGCLLPNLGEKQVKGIFVFLVYIFFFLSKGTAELRLLIRFSKFVPWLCWQREPAEVTVEER